MDINELRALVRKRHAAATKKVSRLRVNNGVNVGGTKHDPRRDPANIKRYTRAQLNSYLNQLNGFTNRSTQFASGAEGAVLPGSKVRELQREIRKYNARGQKRDASIGDLKLPGQDMTVAERAVTIPTKLRTTSGLASTKPFAESKLKISNIAGVDALNKLIADYKRKNSRDYLPKYIEKQRENARKLLNSIGMPQFIPQFDKLTDDQFDTVFNETELPSGLGMGSGLMQLMSQGKKNAAHDAVLVNLETDIAEHLDWAQNLPPRSSTKRSRKAPRRR